MRVRNKQRTNIQKLLLRNLRWTEGAIQLALSEYKRSLKDLPHSNLRRIRKK